MTGYAAAAAMGLLGLTLTLRVLVLRRRGVRAVRFGQTHKGDFLLPPFFLLFAYLVCANALLWPRPDIGRLFESKALAWLGVALCWFAFALVFWSLLSFGKSFRIGIDEKEPGALVTTGAFAFSRNPIYVAFFAMLLGIFLVFPDAVFALYLIAAPPLFHRQVLREEASLKRRLGGEYEAYLKRVRRYL